MTNTGFDNLKHMLMSQYAVLENLSEEQTIAKLEKLDFPAEFKKLKWQSKVNKFVILLSTGLSVGLFLFNLFIQKSANQISMSILSTLFAIAFIVIVFQKQLNNILLKIRLLGLLFEFYKK